METKELMIGDWVRIKEDVELKAYNLYVGIRPGQCIKVEELWNSGIIFEKSCHIFTDAIEPIPLTNEILKTNGLVRDGGASCSKTLNVCIIHRNKHRLQLIIGYPWDDCMIKTDVRYVHELQHAFRLAGIDKEIKLED